MEPEHKRQPILRKEPGKGWALKNYAMLQIPLAEMEEASPCLASRFSKDCV